MSFHHSIRWYVLITGSSDDQKFKERMEWLNQQYIECVKKCDTEGVKKLYVDDCIQMVPGMETMYGKDG